MNQHIPPDTSPNEVNEARESIMNWFRDFTACKTAEGLVMYHGKWISKTEVEEIFRNRKKDAKGIFIDLIILYCVVFVLFLCIMKWGWLLLFQLTTI